MTDDNNNDADPIERANEISQIWTGEEITPQKMVDEFALYGFQKRANYLDDLEQKLKAPNDSNLRKLSDLIELRGSLSELHHKLRKAGR